MLEFLLEPLIDMQYFGCPDDCIVPDSQQHVFVNFLVTPIVWIIIGVGATLGTLKRLGKLKLRKRKPKEQIKVPEYASRIVQAYKKDDKKQTKKEKREYLKNLKNLRSTNNPEEAYQKFLASLDPEHPQTKALQSVPTITKEIPVPEQTVIEKATLEEQEKQVKELMETEKISEDEAVERIITESMPNEMIVDAVNPDLDDELDDLDIFQQDIPERKYPKQLKTLQKKLKIKPKQPKGRLKLKLNDLGKQRRDQYAKQIESKILKWTFPMPEYVGKNKEFQLDQDQITLGIKRLSLFLSMGEFMADKKRKKKRYWQKIRI